MSDQIDIFLQVIPFNVSMFGKAVVGIVCYKQLSNIQGSIPNLRIPKNSFIKRFLLYAGFTVWMTKQQIKN